MSISIANPADSALFAPSFATLGSLLGTLLGVLLVVERRHLRELWQRTLFQRWLTWLVLGPLYALAILGGKATALLLIGAFVFQGLREYARLVGLPRLSSGVLLTMGLGAVPVALVSREAFLGLPPPLLLIG